MDKASVPVRDDVARMMRILCLIQISTVHT